MQPSKMQTSHICKVQVKCKIQTQPHKSSSELRVRDVVVLNPDDPVPLPIRIKPEDSSLKKKQFLPLIHLRYHLLKYFTQKVQKLKDNFHIPSTSEVGRTQQQPKIN